ncbi:MaoC/PaaZ C-terminal domain-containing protein [Solirubrobacter soli]|uniref:MaoC/PaaZ C-terminal domain-containing protein n=1 Tax=Solirubrobacter soli TaxID=363832 RepID=UPI0003FC77BC|nr:MaoC/PaaZ C-terminal domain-containing protein [Solirubrobacter soli]
MLTTLKAALPFGSSMPEETLKRTVTVDRDALAKYAHLCGFTLRDELPPTYPHVLAFGAQMELLARAPFSAVGVVHIANRITQHRPLLLGEELALSVRISELRPHRRGRVFDFLTHARVDDELVWESASTNLKRGEGDESVRDEWAFEDVPVLAQWRLADDLGRRYAAVSGDHNPIHLHAWAAKPFGFPRAIAHGMWTKARCLAALRLPDAFTAEVRFKKPILLPGTVTFGEAEDRFAVHGHVEGRLST